MRWWDALDRRDGSGPGRDGLLHELTKTTDAPSRAPHFDVVLLDDDDHCYYYVVEMLCTLFGYDVDTAYRMTEEVDQRGRVVVFTGPRDEAERKCHQILSYGPDPWLAWSDRSMDAVIERSSQRDRS